MTPTFGEVEPLAGDHEVADFDCGSRAQSEWLQRHAFQAHQSGTSRVHVVCLSGTRRVVGYHALAAGSVHRSDAGERVGKGVGRHPIPVVVLARLGVDLQEQGRGLGRALLVDALRRVDAAADSIGIRALLIHCENDDAKAFYLGQAEFEQGPADPLQLMLLIKDLRRALGAD